MPKYDIFSQKYDAVVPQTPKWVKISRKWYDMRL
jgi:hypothetical protein